MINPNFLSDSLAAKVASEVVYSRLMTATVDYVTNEITVSVSKELLDISVVYVEELKRSLLFEKLFKSLESHEKKIGTMMIGIWEAERKIIISNLKKMKKTWLEKDAVDQILYPRKQFEVKIAKEVRPILESLMEERGNEELGKIETELRKPRKQVPIEVGFDVQNPNVQSWLNTYTPRFSNSLEAVSTSKLRTQLMQGIGAGEGIPQLINRINGTYTNWNKFRSESIARSEAIRASNQGALESYRQSGVVRSKVWITHIDAKTCPSCRRLDGKVIALEKNFFNKGDPDEVITAGETTHRFKNDYEDISAPPRHTRCRCTIGVSFEDIPRGKWKPVMNPQEVALWSKDSTIKKSIFHGTQSMEQIMKNGFMDEFIGSNSGNAGVFGQGHYFASSSGYAAPYGRTGQYLTCAVNTTNTCSWKTWQALAKEYNFEAILDKLGMMKGPAKITNILKSKGYDSAIVGGSRLPNAEILIFDAKNIVVVGGG